MRLHRFYTTETIGSKTEVTINSAEFTNQIRRVFRLKTGDSVILFDGSGFDYECSISDMGKEEVMLTVSNSVPSRCMPKKEIHLFAAIVKKDTFEWIVEKATELGVTHIIPVMAERTEKKSLNMERLNKLVIEASEQSGRGSVPVISEIIELEDSLKGIDSNATQTLVFHTEGEIFDAGLPCAQPRINVFIGPEGGWSPRELEMFHSHKLPLKCLGNQVLRAETAVVATLSLVVFGK
ncbi:MAG: 16S rRNA (uracil(1498)-N(3))-methyltransferase [bacterium]|nr:16S rRNA (uracil(1498)-N(3))-methyltransferase [bacterium]